MPDCTVASFAMSIAIRVALCQGSWVLGVMSAFRSDSWRDWLPRRDLLPPKSCVPLGPGLRGGVSLVVDKQSGTEG